jgi:hypothetical protein
MFQLIIAVIGIALVAIMVLAAIWAGGQAFNSSGERALFTTYMNQGAQIEGSLKMYRADNGIMPGVTSTGTCGSIADVSENILCQLKDGDYLASVPPGDWRVGEEGDTIYKPLEDVAQCQRLNEFMKMDFAALEATEALYPTADDGVGCPPCTPPESASAEERTAWGAFKTWPGCRELA